MRSGGNTKLIVLGWVLLLGALYWYFADLTEREAQPNRNMRVTPGAELTLTRSRDGHYYADGEINGKAVKFLLDTGASQIALSPRLANSIGLTPGSAVTLQTAAGPAAGYRTRIARVRVGGIEMHDLGAVVSEGMNDETVLLGMNFLKRLEIVQRGDQMTLRPPTDVK